MNISKTAFPKTSLLHSDAERYHYTDSFSGTVNPSEDTLDIVDIGQVFFSNTPSWINKLFSLRNNIVSVFGLKTSSSATQTHNPIDNFKGQPGERLGLFKVFDKTDTELIFGENDKHLNFRISLLLTEPQKEEYKNKELTISTTVIFHNKWGRIYFLPVKPFHKLIVPVMLKNTIRNLEK